MKRICTFLCLLVATNGFSQDPIDLSDLATPSSPAFVLMDLSPSTVFVPSNLKALSLNVLSDFASNDNSNVPKNYAIELTPFWYIKNSNMDFKKYYNLRGENYEKQNIFGDIFKRASVSIAFTDNDYGVYTESQRALSVGVRTSLIKMISKNSIEKINQSNTKFYNYIKSLPIQISPTQEELDARREQIANSDEYKALSQALQAKPVFVVDFAAAYSTLLEDNDGQLSDTFARFGAWLSTDLAFNFTKNNTQNYFHFYTVFRYLRDGLNVDDMGQPFTTTVFDFGGKVEFELDKLSIGYEYVSREGDTDSYRSVGTIKYRINDKFLLEGGFGDSFKAGDTAISILGIKWGIDSGNESVNPSPE